MSREFLVIRRRQLEVLGLTAVEAYLQRLARHVTTVFPSHGAFVLSRRGQAWLRDGVKEARHWGITDEHSTALFTDLRAALGERFLDEQRYTWIRELVSERGLSGSARMFLVYQQLPQRCPSPPLAPPPFNEDFEAPAVPPLVPLARERDWG